MPRRISAQVEGRILALGAQKYSRFMIKKELLKSSIVASERTVTNVLNREAKAALCMLQVSHGEVRLGFIIFQRTPK